MRHARLSSLLQAFGATAAVAWCCTSIAAVAMTTCRLELMGLPDVAAYQRLARGVLRRCEHLYSGLNIPNKKPGEPLLEWASVLAEELPGKDVCVHYSLKHQRAKGREPTEVFIRFCQDAVARGVSRVLLVTGPNGPAVDAVEVLERLKGRHPAPGWLKLGVAFNPCLPDEAARERERARLERKLKTSLVDDVWLNTGSDADLYGTGIAFVKKAAAQVGKPEVDIFGSALLPNEAQLQQMRERPWNGVHFSSEYLSSLDGMAKVTREVLATYVAEKVEPIIESKVRNDDDIAKLQKLLAVEPRRVLGSSSSIPPEAARSKPEMQGANDQAHGPGKAPDLPKSPGRRWGNRGVGRGSPTAGP